MRHPQAIKKCTACGILKPRDEFYKKTNTTVQPQCKECFVEINKSYRINNLEKDKLRHQKYYQKNKKRIIEKVAIWNKNHPKERSKYMVFQNAVRRGRILSNGGTFTKAQWDNLIEENNGKCYYCGESFEKLTVDHYIPLSKGGSNYIDNIVPACKSCNCKKGNKMPNDHKRNVSF